MLEGLLRRAYDSRMIQYLQPERWLTYDRLAVIENLVKAKSEVLSLMSLPYQKAWVDALQQIQLKREVAGTSRIEGADFTESELDSALLENIDPEVLLTRSQKQAHAAVQTYRWIASLPNDRPVDGDLIKEVHCRIVMGCDDDHCPPGLLRGPDQNVTFGNPRHRGCEGGQACAEAFRELAEAINREFPEHDPLIQALALHYHLAAMHPFLDGNGRTARALEALLLQRSGLKDSAFIAMSNYYYDEKKAYLESLAVVRAQGNDLTAFLNFGLRGITLQCQRLSAEIKKNLKKALFRNTMYDLFNRLESTRKRVIKDRQIEILKLLLEVDQVGWQEFVAKIRPHYTRVKNFEKALFRDLSSLEDLRTISFDKVGKDRWVVSIRLEWPSEISESDFFEKIKALPKAKTFRFLQ
jgi:Fic family protein